MANWLTTYETIFVVAETQVALHTERTAVLRSTMEALYTAILRDRINGNSNETRIAVQLPPVTDAEFDSRDRMWVRNSDGSWTVNRANVYLELEWGARVFGKPAPGMTLELVYTPSDNEALFIVTAVLHPVY